MTTATTALTASYVKKADSGAWTALQNTGNSEMEVIITTSTAPSDTDKGFKFKVLDTVLPSTYGDGDIYVKARGADVGQITMTDV